MPGADEIIAALTAIGLPVAHRQFLAYKDKPVPDPPYIVYLFPFAAAHGADERNLYTERTMRIELYAGERTLELEAAIEDVLISAEWTKEEDYIESEELYMTAYEIVICEKIKRKAKT